MLINNSQENNLPTKTKDNLLRISKIIGVLKMSVEIQIPGLVQVTDLIDPLIAEIISGGMKGQCMITFMRVNSKHIYII